MVLSAGLANAGNLPDSALYAGLGGSLNSVSYRDQSVWALGISDVYSTSTHELLASGTADGPPVNVNLSTETALGPNAQIGYFRKFDDPAYLWGGKFTYAYPSASSTTSPFLIPQYGSFGTTPFTGNALVQSYQSTLQQQASFLPYLGKSFQDGFAYLGIGPTLSQVTSKVNGVVGFADINGQRGDISGAPQSFTKNNWVGGWQAGIGGTYFFDRTWFLDLSYTYGRTAHYTADLGGAFTNVSASSGRTYVGNLIGTASGYLITNAIALTVNKTF